MLIYQRVNPIRSPLNHHKITIFLVVKSPFYQRVWFTLPASGCRSGIIPVWDPRDSVGTPQTCTHVARNLGKSMSVLPWLGMVNIYKHIYLYTYTTKKKWVMTFSFFLQMAYCFSLFLKISCDQRWCSHHAPGFAPPWLCLVRWIGVLQMIGPLVHWSMFLKKHGLNTKKNMFFYDVSFWKSVG